MSDKKVSPIKPDEIESVKEESFPDAVLESFNELIVRNFSERSSTVTQDEVIALMKKKGLKENKVFANHWLDVEGVYRKAGWEVLYDKPGYNETGRAFFTFTRPKK